MKVHNLLQGSKEWFEIRLGKVSGTVLKDLMGTSAKRSDTLHEIIGETLQPEVDMEHLHENPMSRGMRCEDSAVQAFSYVTGKKCIRCGIITSDEDERICYSPDALIDNEPEDVECKVPEVKNYMKIVLSNEIPKEYYWQIVQGFVVRPELTKRYFVAFCPEITSYPLHIIECNRSDYTDDIAKALDEQKKFLAEVDDKLASLNL